MWVPRDKVDKVDKGDDAGWDKGVEKRMSEETC